MYGEFHTRSLTARREEMLCLEGDVQKDEEVFTASEEPPHRVPISLKSESRKVNVSTSVIKSNRM